MAAASTLKGLLKQMKWHFHEKGLVKVWNELATFANQQDDEGAVTFSGRTYFGDLILASDTLVAYYPTFADETEGRAGAGGITYPAAKYPVHGAGFKALL